MTPSATRPFAPQSYSQPPPQKYRDSRLRTIARCTIQNEVVYLRLIKLHTLLLVFVVVKNFLIRKISTLFMDCAVCFSCDFLLICMLGRFFFARSQHDPVGNIKIVPFKVDLLRVDQLRVDQFKVNQFRVNQFKVGKSRDDQFRADLCRE